MGRTPRRRYRHLDAPWPLQHARWLSFAITQCADAAQNVRPRHGRASSGAAQTAQDKTLDAMTVVRGGLHAAVRWAAPATTTGVRSRPCDA
ncbi:hypothetical protein XFF6970_320071 [Xanthomonas citri pv. fuscans]|nr:hypothetical protein XFF6970_320071 [Xanthomonas citri pv. fuscans]